LKVEHTEKVRAEDLPRVESVLLERMHGLLKIRPAVTWLQPNSLERSAKKTTLLEKTYE
jgi:phenylacetate-CoA ligase